MQDEDAEVEEQDVEEPVAGLDSDEPTGTDPHNPVEMQHDTNPTHVIGETYDDYLERNEATGLVPASEAEWANAPQVPLGDEQSVGTARSAASEDDEEEFEDVEDDEEEDED